MSVRRVMGIETEYGISVPGQPEANAMVTSSQVVNAYRGGIGGQGHGGPGGTSRRRTRCATPAGSTWPRGRRPQPAHRRGPRPGQRHPDQRRPALRRPRPPRVLLARGAPTRGTRCCGTRPASASWPRPRAGPPRCPAPARSSSTRTTPTTRAPRYGCHENYLMKRETPFADIVRHLTPFFVSRQVVCGAGRVGIGADGRGTASRSASAPTSSRSRSASRRR